MEIKLKPTNEIIARLGFEPNGKAQKYFTSECAKKMDKFVPKRNGILRQYELHASYIIYKQEYAKYQYYGMRKDGSHKVKHYTTKGTGTYWDKKMWSADGKTIVREMQDKFGR